MAIAVKQPASTGHEAIGIYMLTDPASGTTAQNLEAARRVQSYTLSIDEGTENTHEFADESIVEVKRDIPVVGLDLEIRQVATNPATNVSGLQALALVSNNVPSGASREKVFAIGDPLHLHTAATLADVPTAYTEVDDFDELITSPGDASSQVLGVTTDVLIPYKTGTTLNRAFTTSQMYATAIGWSFPVEGFPAFTVSLQADNYGYYQDTYKDVEVESHLLPAGTASPLTITGAAAVYKVYVDNEEIEAAAAQTDIDAPGARKYYWDSGASTTLYFSAGLLAAGKTVRIRFQPASAAPAWSGGSGLNYGLAPGSGAQGGLRNDEVDIWLLTDTTAGRVVEGCEPAKAADDITINPGTLYLINNSSSLLELYRYTSTYTFVTSMAQADDVLYANTKADGTLVFSMEDTAALPSTAVVIASTTNTGPGVLTAVADARDFGRYDLPLIQNANFAATLNRTPVRQLGYSRNVENALEKPVPITVDFTAMDVDAEILTLLRGGDYANLGNADREITDNEFSTTVGVQVNLYTSNSRTDTNKRIVIEATDARVTNLNHSGSIGAAAEFSATLAANALRAFEVA